MSENKTPCCEISSDGNCICADNTNCADCPVYGVWLYEQSPALARILFEHLGEEHNND